VKVRQALNNAVDREGIVKAVLQGQASPRMAAAHRPLRYDPNYKTLY